jgi:hypothetical protein
MRDASVQIKQCPLVKVRNNFKFSPVTKKSVIGDSGLLKEIMAVPRRNED